VKLFDVGKAEHVVGAARIEADGEEADDTEGSDAEQA
jgi:hypothetical protein